MKPSWLSVLVLVGACGDSDHAPPDAPARTLTVTLVRAPADLAAAGLAFAYQDGNGAWQPAPEPIDGVITIGITGETYGFARSCTRLTSDVTSIAVVYSTMTERPSFSQSLFSCAAPTDRALGAITGSLTTIAERDHELIVGTASTSVSTAIGETATTFDMDTTQGTADLIAVRSDVDGVVDRFSIERDLVVGATPVTKDLDFNALAAPETVPQPLAGATDSFFFADFHTATSSRITFDDVPPYAIVGPPATQRLATDYFDVGLDVFGTDVSDVYVEQVQSAPQALVVPANAMGPVTGALVPGTPSVRVSWTPLAEPDARYLGAFHPACATNCTIFGFASFSPGWLGSSMSWTTPDFTTAPALPPFDFTSGTVSISGDLESGTYPEPGYRYVSHTRGVRFGATARTDPAAHAHRLNTVRQRRAPR